MVRTVEWVERSSGSSIASSTNKETFLRFVHALICQKKRIPLIVIWVFLTILFSTSRPALACVCRGAEEPPCVSYEKADVIFVGSVVGLAETPLTPPEMFKKLLVLFAIDRPVKGTSGNQIQIATVTGTDCDFEFEIGQHYFVYAYQDGNPTKLVTGVCTRTRLLSRAQDDLSFLTELTSTAHRTLILGRDGNGPESPLNGSEIIIEGQGRKYRAVVDKNGAFRMEVSIPGKYTITVIGAGDLQFLNRYSSWRVFSVDGRPAIQFERSVTKGRCDFIDFSLYLTIRKN